MPQTETIAEPRGAVIFPAIANRGSSPMRCVCIKYYLDTSTRIRIAKPFPFSSPLIFLTVLSASVKTAYTIPICKIVGTVPVYLPIF